ncbi:hypothetical protein [Streptomyces sp. NPDC090112]|uniref:hypothetical protein n=1 Tax=Streptomyces sp. NPDC090112 TaxID=3365949 RepID=UPI003808A7A6
MTNGWLLPTQYLTAGERLVHGKGVGAAVGAGRAEDWVRLDTDVHSGTLDRAYGWKCTLSLRIGAHWFDSREVADWDTVPHWNGDGLSWTSPPTESELALCLCNADPRVRAKALEREAARAPLPLLLLRCADTAPAVRERARTAFAAALAAAGDGSVRSLAVLALHVGVRKHGAWARELVLARTGGAGEAEVRELLACEGRHGEDARTAGVRAGAEAGVLDADDLYRIALRTDRSHKERLAAVRTALSADRRDGAGGERAARKRFVGFLERCETSQLRVRALGGALSAHLLSADELAGLACAHRDRKVRRIAARTLLELPGAEAFLDRLLAASDGVVRGRAMTRLRALGRAQDLVPHLTDPSPWARDLACRELRAAGTDPHALYQAWCADPATVTPAAVSGLAALRELRDGPLFRTLARHADGAVRARALGGLRRLGLLDADGLARHADDPDPRVAAVVLRGLRDDAEVLRGMLGHPHGRVRGAALTHLAHRHTLGWEEALPFLSDPAKEASRAARGALRGRGSRIPEARLLELVAPGELPQQRALAMELLERSFEPGPLLAALRLVDDPLPAVRATARKGALRILWDRDAARGPHAEEICALGNRHAGRLPAWKAEQRRRAALGRK